MTPKRGLRSWCEHILWPPMEHWFYLCSYWHLLHNGSLHCHLALTSYFLEVSQLLHHRVAASEWGAGVGSTRKAIHIRLLYFKSGKIDRTDTYAHPQYWSVNLWRNMESKFCIHHPLRHFWFPLLEPKTKDRCQASIRTFYRRGAAESCRCTAARFALADELPSEPVVSWQRDPAEPGLMWP